MTLHGAKSLRSSPERCRAKAFTRFAKVSVSGNTIYRPPFSAEALMMHALAQLGSGLSQTLTKPGIIETVLSQKEDWCGLVFIK